MSDRPAPDPQPGIIAGQYVVDITKPLPDAGGGIPAYVASGRHPGASPLMALRVDRHAPVRPRPLQTLITGIDGLLTPVAQGLGPPVDGQPAWFVICLAPPGPPLSAQMRPWPEHMLIELVMKPIALVLEQLQARNLTHRAIRANNVFQGAPGRPVTLGAAWAAPPAMHQTALHETAYTAICHPSGRGDGRIADDVYALGILLITLATGRQPFEGVDDKTVMHQKLELGDFAAVVGNERMAPMLTDIVRGMLAEDPDHRPTPALLRDPAGARGRRVAARPASRAQRSFKLGAITVWNTKTLALAMALDPGEAVSTMLSGAMMYWLRRGLGNSNLAVKLEELIRLFSLDTSSDKATAHATLVMRAIADIDIFMPMCWRGLAVFPEGIGPVLAANVLAVNALAAKPDGDPDPQQKLREIFATEAQGVWAAMRVERAPDGPQRLEARQRRALMQIRGLAGGLPRLSYTLNAQTPCASPLLQGRWVTSVRDLAPALDAIATASPNVELLDAHTTAFIAARSERRLEQEVKPMSNDDDAAGHALTALRLLSEVQAQFHPVPMVGLAAWCVSRAEPLLERWRNRDRRAEMDAQLKILVAAGILQPIVALLEDHAGHQADAEDFRLAQTELARIDAELLDLAEGGTGRAALSARLGQEIAAGIGVAAVAITLILAALG